MKNNKTKTVRTSNAAAPVCVCSRGHRVWSAVALIGLFLCGLMIGLPIGARHNSIGDEKQQLIGMTAKQCDDIATRIMNAMNSYPTDASLIAELNKLYSDNCAGRVFIQQKEAKEATRSPESQEYKLAARPDSDMPTCERIEVLLADNLIPDMGDYRNAMINANIYASMVEYGCPENAEQNRKSALEALQIANALSNDLAQDQNNAYSVIDTYKKLEMQTQAREFLNKVQKLTDPAIDFILQMEKIINE